MSNVGAGCRMQRIDFMNRSLKLLFQNYHQVCKEAKLHSFFVFSSLHSILLLCSEHLIFKFVFSCRVYETV